ncbi:MAG TPA: methyltransferase domain-containing protein [Saprospiraceae bacterium]|nr:methyltransferase domain-containing protein [Saprospiraceae bacterium]
MDLKELEAGVDPHVHWYYQSKAVPLRRYLKQRIKASGPITIVDFGSGSGFFSELMLHELGSNVKMVYQVDIGYTDEELGEQSDNKKITRVRYTPKNIENAVVVMMDVLEHIEDDEGILKEISEAISKPFHYFITVPAFMSVWSSHDVYLEHYRRYTLPHLTRVLQNVGYSCDAGYYIFQTIFPMVWVVRRLKRQEKNMQAPDSSDMSPMPGWLNGLLKSYHQWEMSWGKVNKRFGLTCVAEGHGNG